MLSKFSVRKPFTVLVAVVIVLVFGAIAYMKMTPDLFPKINTPYAIVMTTYPGASPEEVETQITKPMEQQLASLSNLKNINSISADNYSMVQMEFSDDVNMDSISVDIREKIDQIKAMMPETAGTPVVMKISMDMMPTVTAAVGMKGKNSGEVSQFTKENLQKPLEGTEGVASVTTMGMIDNNIQIVLSQEKIDEVNDKVAAAITGQFADGKGKINSGISQAKGGKKKISSGKKQLTQGQQEAIEKMEAAKTQIQNGIAELKEMKKNAKTMETLYLQYQAAPAEQKAVIEQQVAQMGMSIQQLGAMVEQLNDGSVDKQIKALETSLEQLNVKESTTSFALGSQYSELTAAESTITATVNQLQSALEEVKSAEDAALTSADMTGVLTMNNISAILNAQNFSMPAGYVTDGDAKLLVSVGDKIKDKKELQNMTLMDMGIDGLDPIKLSDIATVTYSDDAADTYAKINGENGVLLSFTKQSSYATAEVSSNISDKFTELEDKYGELEFITLYDQGDYIHIVISSVLNNLLLGALLAILILLFFLRDIRPTLITAVSIPLSVIFAIVLMYFSGVTLNMISLAGLAIGVGMLVDNSIVVVENIYRLRTLGYSIIQSAVSGAVQVAGAITASTLTTICVFVPIVFVDGMTKDIFVDLALTVAYSLLASLIIALTLVPAMAKGLLKKEPKKTVLDQDSRFLQKYKNFVEWSLHHKKIVLPVAIILLIGSTGLAVAGGFSFMPSMATPQISASIQMPENSTLEETSKATDKVVAAVEKVDGVESVGAMLSSNAMGMMGMSAAEQDTTQTMVYIVLDQSKTDQGKKIKKILDQQAEKLGCEITSSADMDMSAMMGGAGVALNLYSDDLDLLRKTGASIEKELNQMKELEEVSDINEDSTTNLRVIVNKNLAMKEGLTVAQVYQQVQAKLAKESTATTLNQASKDMDVIVENTTSKQDFTRNDLENMKLTVDKKDGTKEKVTLSSIARIETGASMNAISHNNQKRSLEVTAGIKDGYNVTLVTKAVKQMIEDKNLVPHNVTIDYGGENQEIMDAMQQMLLMILVGLILVYLVMVAQFQSLRSPFIIIFTIPLAFTGGMLALLIGRQDVSVVSMMGFVMLMGVIVNNGIVLVDCINRFRLEGMEMNEAILSAGAVRMRPVIMTALTTVLGLLPLAIGMGTGSEMMQPVALVCIGGLLYGTLTTMIIIPVMYKLLAKKHMEKIEEEELEIVTV